MIAAANLEINLTTLAAFETVQS